MSNIYTDSTYLSQNPTWHVEDAPFKAAGVLEVLRLYNLDGAPTTIADVGCGAGQVAQILAAEMPEVRVSGFDVSPDAARLWRAGAVRFVLGDFACQRESFDVVMLLDVLEHVPDYLGFLRAVRPRGRMFVFNIPLDMNVASMAFGQLSAARRSVGHLHYFNRETALATLGDCGYQILVARLRPGFRSAPEARVRWKQRLIDIPRRFAYPVSPSTCAFWFGGVSLLVLARV